MTHVVGGGEAHRQVIGHIVLTELLCIDQSSGEIRHELIAGRPERQSRGEVPVVRGAISMRESSAKAGKVGLVLLVICVAKQVFILFMKQFP